MTTVLELADHAGLPVETVLRVLLREPTNEAARRSVELAVAALGLPAYPRPDDHVEVLPAVPTSGEVGSPTGPPGDHPPLELVSELRAVLHELVERLDRERQERVNDLELSTNLLTEGWRNVDRRLGRLEKMIERLDRREFLERTSPAGAEVHRLDDLRRPAT
jgi:hypothetical protein